MKYKKAVLNSYDAMILEVKSRYISIKAAGEELGYSEKKFESSHKRVVLELRKQGAGQFIEGSRLTRAFCPRCLEPIRVDDGVDVRMCQECSPPHRGVGYSAGGEIGNLLNDVDHDPDAYLPSWRYD